MNYSVTCLSDDAPTLSGTSTTTFLLFTKVDGVRAGTDYTCHVTMTVSAYNGTYLGGGPLGSLWTRTTPKSQTASITTLEGKGWYEPSCFFAFNICHNQICFVIVLYLFIYASLIFLIWFSFTSSSHKHHNQQDKLLLGSDVLRFQVRDQSIFVSTDQLRA